MNKIVVVSPAGSGMNFAVEALNIAFKERAIGGKHIRSEIDESAKQIAIIRNPYDAIASGAERWINTSGHRDFDNKKAELLDIKDTQAVVLTIDSHSREYINFFKDIEAIDNIKLFSFEFVTQNHNQFIKEVAEYFGISPIVEEVLIKDIFYQIDLKNNRNRRPRETTEARKIIDDLVKKSYAQDNWEAWEIYSGLKANLDAKGL
jgi:hypothetical protein